MGVEAWLVPGWDWDFNSGPQANCTAKPPDVLLIEHVCSLTTDNPDSVSTQKSVPKRLPEFFLRHCPSFVEYCRDLDGWRHPIKNQKGPERPPQGDNETES